MVLEGFLSSNYLLSIILVLVVMLFVAVVVHWINQNPLKAIAYSVIIVGIFAATIFMLTTQPNLTGYVTSSFFP